MLQPPQIPPGLRPPFLPAERQGAASLQGPEAEGGCLTADEGPVKPYGLKQTKKKQDSFKLRHSKMHRGIKDLLSPEAFIMQAPDLTIRSCMQQTSMPLDAGFVAQDS